ncbi:FKBP-type peptidyl-prolyl cis-trans isomerase [Flavilitoribacter nigricans]|uniref:Peptidyl-prolyl cis-trans isomerase n=1 Tax=Flavilitoribacter nigricans (strain ATCC 23147 / DSM 23189 / NBRC 102662 / NCIMB 1420 / SS-2) TaxID=1122177 RepID=A0A2D0N991_FLAN2|nr:FKBP-type peptidyl-prolyl cis-trans isomerase [Flavilitoribacter nigricans]PHN05047.1 peptidylprolyl isomerase [Flavilitoribacter nigricans DSM 23189 = NBRC 102662]
MTVDEQRIITIAYELREANAEGPVVEIMDANWPFKFYYGSGKLLPAFEEKLYGLEEGEAFKFILSPAEAYGEVRQSEIIDLPMDLFEQSPETPLAEGKYVTVTDDQGGQHNGMILSWNNTAVKVDFNHAMAGKALHFSGVILNVRSATVDELIRKSYIKEDGVRGN